MVVNRNDNSKRIILLVLSLFICCHISTYAQKEKYNLHVSIDDCNSGSMAGLYSLSVCDADIVPIDTANATAVAELLLCSELHGQIERPNYYFSGHPNAMHHLDLLMMTQGWRRYDLSAMLNERYPTIHYGIEQEQTIKGYVRTTLKKHPRNMKLVMFNPQTFRKETFELGDSSNFTINGVDYMEGETLSLEATRGNGSTSHVELNIEPVDVPQVTIPENITSLLLPDSVGRYVAQARQHLMYMNADKVIELPDVKVKGKRKKWKNRLGTVDCGISAGDPLLQKFPDIQSMLRSLGIMVRVNNDGTPFFGRQSATFMAEGFTLTPTYIDNALTPQEELWDILPTDISQIEYLTPNSPSNIIYGSEAVAAGCLLIYLKDGGHLKREKTGGSLSSRKVRQIGYSPHVEFYSPRYETDNSTEYPHPDYRTTLYWNPKMEVSEDGELNCEFYHSDTSRRLLVTLEGVSNEGVVVSKRFIKE